MVVLPIMLWWQWDKIEKLPGVAPLVEKLDGFKALPQASGKSFSIVLARLADDKDDKHRKVISEALGRYSVVEILIASRMITSSGSDNMQKGIRLGHERARQLLVEPEL